MFHVNRDIVKVTKNIEPYMKRLCQDQLKRDIACVTVREGEATGVFSSLLRKTSNSCRLFEKEQESGSNLQRQRLASPTAQVLVAHTTQPVQKKKSALDF